MCFTRRGWRYFILYYRVSIRTNTHTHTHIIQNIHGVRICRLFFFFFNNKILYFFFTHFRVLYSYAYVIVVCVYNMRNYRRMCSVACCRPINDLAYYYCVFCALVSPSFYYYYNYYYDTSIRTEIRIFYIVSSVNKFFFNNLNFFTHI